MERPILFSGEMVRAILEGRKTQTRRVVKGVNGNDKILEFGIYSKALFTDNILNTFSGKRHDFLVKCPYGLPGDRLWVRETWQGQEQNGKWWHEVKEHRELYNWAWTNPIQPAFEATPPRWLPGIYMPRQVRRIMLEIVDVRVQRVQEITPADCKAEGIFIPHPVPPITTDEAVHHLGEYRKAFIELWDNINLKRGFGWETNPYVWAITIMFIAFLFRCRHICHRK